MGKTNAMSRISAIIIAPFLLIGEVSAANGPAKFLGKPESWFAGPEAK